MLSTCTKLDLLDVIYTYKDKAGLVGFYLHVQRKKLDLLLDYYLHVQRKKLDTYMHIEKSWTCWMLYILQRKKLDLFR